MAIILGLDVSTSCVGVCIIGDDWFTQLEAIRFNGCNTLWEKADRVKSKLERLHDDVVNGTKDHQGISRVVIEEALMGFRPGMSSAQTISTLLRFNGVVSYLSREVLGIDPEYVSANHARKACGIKLQRTAVAGMSQKDQVFKHMSENDLKDVKWPLKKNGQPVDWAKDATDAYVIAKAAAIEGVIIPVKKSKKSKKDD